MSVRALLPFVPSAIIFALACAGWFKLRAETSHARQRLVELHESDEQQSSLRSLSAVATPESAEEIDLDTAPPAALRRELRSLEQQLAVATTSIEKIRSEADHLEGQIPIGDDELTSSYGRVEDMGREAGLAIRLLGETMSPRPSGAAAEPSEELQEQLHSGFFKLVAWATQVGSMESDPAEIATFQSAALREFYGLDEATADQIEAIIATHFTQLAADGLSVPDRPDDDGFRDWKRRRGVALQELMSELHPMFPERDPGFVRQFLPAIFNLGAGMESGVHQTVDGRRSANIGFPSWPTPPWLD